MDVNLLEEWRKFSLTEDEALVLRWRLMPWEILWP
jgi:hypothetical protein